MKRGAVLATSVALLQAVEFDFLRNVSSESALVVSR